MSDLEISNVQISGYVSSKKNLLDIKKNPHTVNKDHTINCLHIPRHNSQSSPIKLIFDCPFILNIHILILHFQILFITNLSLY